ncbi:helix-turn-helix domain-containing protein [Microbispora sp. NBC_01389]|uniref:helix-turn-helix domain-containing protein n=1 Tax=Microbispora sp. NBC_01389 TaxID=2903584 RepID=UPI00324DCF72
MSVPRSSEPVDPAASPWHLLGSAVRHWREEVRHLSQREVAKAAYLDDGDLSKWERGLARPHADVVARLDSALGAGQHLVALHATVAELERLRTVATGPRAEEEIATERRHLLQLAIAGTLGAGSEPVRRLLGDAFGQEFRSVEDWEPVCADHLYALRTRPPAQVASDLLVDLLAVRRQSQTAPPTQAVELQRITAALASVEGNVLTRLGEHAAALRWWRTARQAADASGDLGLRLMVRAEEAGHGLYGQRDPEAVLRLVESAERIAGGPTADLLTTRSKALSMLGRHDEARGTVRALVALAAGGVKGDTFGFWKPDQIHFAESWVYAGAGDEAAADRARQQVLAATRDYQYDANVRLHEALCTVSKGGVDTGLRQAATVITTLPAAYRSHHIVQTGRLVLRAVPADQRGRRAVGEFRELLGTGAGAATA